MSKETMSKILVSDTEVQIDNHKFKFLLPKKAKLFAGVIKTAIEWYDSEIDEQEFDPNSPYIVIYGDYPEEKYCSFRQFKKFDDIGEGFFEELHDNGAKIQCLIEDKKEVQFKQCLKILRF